ncbi:MAG TPA: helix-turn-helix domain-containing protein [Sphingobium sp.]|nr:helix-turn-helix domain-containing protein [Sphingobium sp.]
MAVSPVARHEAGMDNIWSTSGFDSQTKMTRWTSIVSEHMTEMCVDSTAPRHFSAVWRQYGLGPLELNFINAAAQKCRRSPQMIVRGAEPSYELVYMQSGAMIVAYEHEREYVPEGSFTLLRNAEPYSFTCPEQSNALTAHVSDSWLRRWVVSHDNFTHVSHETRQAWGGPLAALFTAIAQNGLEEATLPRSVIADQIGALFALMSRHDGAGQTRNQQTLVARLRTMMRGRLEDTGLNPEGLARSCGISKRYLHMLFANMGTTFGKELLNMRLEQAKTMLDDPRHARRSIADISFDCGFAEQSHFARRFRHRYGVNPTSHRRSRQ